MKKYLVTGCAGFIGSNFIYYMLGKYDDILLVNLDKLTYAGNLENLKGVEGDPRHVFVQGDICDKDLVADLFNKYDFDYVINLQLSPTLTVPSGIPRSLLRRMCSVRSIFFREQRTHGMTLLPRHGKRVRNISR